MSKPPPWWGYALWLGMVGVGVALAGMAMTACATAFRWRP